MPVSRHVGPGNPTWVLLTTEPSLQPPDSYFLKFKIKLKGLL